MIFGSVSFDCLVKYQVTYFIDVLLFFLTIYYESFQLLEINNFLVNKNHTEKDKLLWIYNSLRSNPETIRNYSCIG